MMLSAVGFFAGWFRLLFAAAAPPGGFYYCRHLEDARAIPGVLAGISSITPVLKLKRAANVDDALVMRQVPGGMYHLLPDRGGRDERVEVVERSEECSFQPANP